MTLTSTATTALDVTLYAQASIIVGGRLYVIGGNDPNFNTGVRFASVDAFGVTGPWTSTTPLPTQFVAPDPVFPLGRVAYSGGYLFVVAPLIAENDLAVLSGFIEEDGTIAAWVACNPITPEASEDLFTGFDVFEAGGYLYVGGSGDGTTRVMKAQITGGTVGTWAETTPLPVGRKFPSLFAVDGYAYCAGGCTGNYYDPDPLYELDILAAPIGVDGELGAWSVIGQLPAGGFYDYAMFEAGGRLYLHDYILWDYLVEPTPRAIYSASLSGTTLGEWALETGEEPLRSRVWGSFLPVTDEVFLLVGGAFFDLEATQYPTDEILRIYAPGAGGGGGGSGFSAGAATVYKAIPVDLEYNPLTGAVPGVLKQFSEATYHFNLANIYNFEATFRTELSTTEDAVPLSTSGFSIYTSPTEGLNARIFIPVEKQRGSMLRVGLNVSEAWAKWQLNGVTIEASGTSERNSR